MHSLDDGLIPSPLHDDFPIDPPRPRATPTSISMRTPPPRYERPPTAIQPTSDTSDIHMPPPTWTH
ncbi:hypothetical protein H0H93_000225 [Arthromyces matolae]|nr:hypothetical protein H0H93_000225 [Arthromyces matolae]